MATPRSVIRIAWCADKSTDNDIEKVLIAADS